MGQRLVFKCLKGGKTFATIYYHWSGYTQSIYWEAAELFKGLREQGYTGEESIETLQKMLLDYLEARGGGVSGSKDDDGKLYEVEAWQKRGVNPLTDGVNRNNGLLDITDKGMRNAEYWAEALEEFDFDDETFTNNEYYHEPEREIDWIEHPEKIPRWEPDPRFIGTIKWDDADAALKWFDSLPRFEGVLGIDEYNEYVTALE